MVKFNEWTSDERLRAPVFLGLRMDGNPDEVVREAPELVCHRMKAKPETEKAHTALLPADAAEITLAIEGRRLKFTNLKKVFYPADGYTKRDVINFYAAVADLLVPHLKARPLSLKRYPNGIDSDFFSRKRQPRVSLTGSIREGSSQPTRRPKHGSSFATTKPHCSILPTWVVLIRTPG